MPHPLFTPEVRLMLDERHDAGLREFVLPYHVVREAADPDAYLLRFLTSAHQGVESLAGWQLIR